MTLPDGANLGRPVAPDGTESPQHADQRGVVGNERLTALAGAVLLVLIAVELVTVPTLHALLSVHIFVGVLLAGPLALKLGSTGYRFVRYYTRSFAYVRRGPPRLALRLLAPLLVATTLVAVGSGIALLVIGPTLAGPVRVVHILSALIWLPLLAIHVAAYLLRVPRLLAEDWSQQPTEPLPGRGRRLGVNLGALLAGAIAAVLVLPATMPWLAWITTNESGPGFFIAGMLLASIAVAGSKVLRWW